MFNQLSDYFFWFAQPSSFLSQQDYIFGYIFLSLLGLAIVFRIVAHTNKHAVNRTLFVKFWHLTVTISVIGLFWFGMRYENTPVFAKHFWAGLNLIIGIIWFGFIVKYLWFNYRQEKTEYERERIKSKYLPGSNK